MSLALRKGFFRASSWPVLERTFRHSFCASLTALATAQDHAYEDRESALQKTSTNSGLAMNMMKASTWAKLVILWISSSPKRPGSHAKPHAAVQKCRFSSKQTSFDLPPSQTNIVHLKQKAGNWRRPLTFTRIHKGALSRYSVILCRFLWSKMAARRLEATAPANKKQALLHFFFLHLVPSIAIDRRRGISQLPLQSHSSLGRSWALSFDQESANEKTSLPWTMVKNSWNPKHACKAPQIDPTVLVQQSRFNTRNLSGAVVCISLHSTMCTSIIDRQDTSWARFVWKDARLPLFFPQRNGAKIH